MWQNNWSQHSAAAAPSGLPMQDVSTASGPYGVPSSVSDSSYAPHFIVQHDPYSTPEPHLHHTIDQAIISANDCMDEVFRLIDVAVGAEKNGHYKAAINSFLSAGEMLVRIADNEPVFHIRAQLKPKAEELLRWCEALAYWLESGMLDPLPARKGRTVLTNVLDRLNSEHVALVPPTAPREFLYLSYTAVTTTTPSDFTNDQYALRCVRNGRMPRIMIVVTMYNEDETELQLTLRKIANNIKLIHDKKLPGYIGDEAWQQFLICVVSDGRMKANQGTLDFLKEVGVFDEDVMMITSAGTSVQMHLFEYTVSFMHRKISRTGGGMTKRSGDSDQPYLPMQIVYGLKEHNAGKLNSHEWFFNAFAEQILPHYTILLDVGTLPTKKAIYKLLSCMERDSNVGGCCGEIAVDRPLPHLCNWTIAAQHFEYKISNILDKATESFFGYISVLPGAFSAYRYRAIRGDPLAAYFKQLTTPQKKLGPFQGNMYLAEDRILCFEIVARKGGSWKLNYVKNAIARTDTPTNLVDLLGQRRRWLNGSFFALLYTVQHWSRIRSQTKHSCLSHVGFMLQYIFMLLQVLLSWIIIPNFYLVIYGLLVDGMKSNSWGFLDTSGIPEWLMSLIDWVFQFSWGLMIFIQFLTALGNKRNHVGDYYLWSAVFFGFFAVAAFIVAVIQFCTQAMTIFTAISAALLLGTYFAAGAIHFELHHVLLSFIQYFALLPTLSITFSIYSFCNLHDLSWGTKGLDTAGHAPAGREDVRQGNYEDIKERKKEEEQRKKLIAKEEDELTRMFGRFRTGVVTGWLVTNLLYVILIELYVPFHYYLGVIICISAIYNLWRLFFSTLYVLGYFKDKICCADCRAHRKNKHFELSKSLSESPTQMSSGTPSLEYRTQIV